MPVVLAVASVIQAQPIVPISMDEWRSILRSKDSEDITLLDIATAHSERATELLNSGQREASFRHSIVSVTLSHFALAEKERAGVWVDQRASNAVAELKSALLDAGVAAAAFDESAENLQAVNQRSSEAANVPLPPRQATARERNTIISTVRRSLIDPTSPIFGRVDIVGDKACVTVNSKNSFGGYTGNQEAILAYSPELREWALGGIIDIPHEACLITKRR